MSGGWDVVVVGGGLIGCAAAYYLAQRRARVALLERGDLNSGASGQNAGSLHFQLEHRMVEHGESGAEQAAVALPLHLDAERTWAGLEDELEADLEVAQRGGLMVAESTDDVGVLRGKQALEQRRGLQTQLLEGDDLRALAPYLSAGVRAASWHPREGKANARLVTPAFARAAIRAGALVRTSCDVEGIGVTGGHWTVRTRHEALRTRAVLVAAGARSGDLLAGADVRLPVVPVALSMIVTQRTRPLVPHLIQHVGQRLSLKQVADGNVLVGGGWPSRLAGANDTGPALLRESLQGSLAVAARIVPAVRNLMVLRAWPGVTAVTADQLPLLGEVARRPGLFVAAGGSAFTLGPTYARLVSELILDGRPSLDVAAYSPRRFAHLYFR